MFALFMFMLILFVGLGIDLGFAYITRARLSKAVDSACLMGLRSYSSTSKQQATDIAKSAFQANYGSSGRDAVPPTPLISFGTTTPNVTIDVTATAQINTFFIRIMPAIFFLQGAPSWQTLTVGSSAQATRPNLIMSLVLDRSGSMNGDGGAAALPGAVTNFVNRFDDQRDRVAMVSFSYAASTDVSMSRPFKQDINNAVKAMRFDGWTCSERGLTNGLAQTNTNSVPLLAGETVVKIIVFFTDGMANTWYYNFDCGPRNISPPPPTPPFLYDPDTGSPANFGCTVPSTLPAIDPETGALTPNAVSTSSCEDIHYEAQRRAERIAYLARDAGNTIYSIGLGSCINCGECNNVFPVLNPDFLKNIANTPDSDTHVTGQPEGDYAIAETPGELDRVFQAIADKILVRLTKSLVCAMKSWTKSRAACSFLVEYCA